MASLTTTPDRRRADVRISRSTQAPGRTGRDVEHVVRRVRTPSQAVSTAQLDELELAVDHRRMSVAFVFAGAGVTYETFVVATVMSTC
jgi:hypothetical protein